jgi:hypothetical protein
MIISTSKKIERNDLMLEIHISFDLLASSTNLGMRVSNQLKTVNSTSFYFSFFLSLWKSLMIRAKEHRPCPAAAANRIRIVDCTEIEIIVAYI